MSSSRNTLINTLSEDAFFRVNKAIVHKVGHVAAILLADLISKYRYFNGTDRITEDDSFYNTSQMIEADTCISSKQRRLCQEKLEKAGLLKTVKRGMPSTNYYYIQWDNVLDCLKTFVPVKYEKTLRTIKKTVQSSQKVTTCDSQKVTTGSDQRYTQIRNKNKIKNKEQNIVDKSTSLHHRTIEIFHKGSISLYGHKLKFQKKDGEIVKQIIKLADNNFDLIYKKSLLLYDRVKNKKYMKGEGFQVSTLISNWNELEIFKEIEIVEQIPLPLKENW